MDSTALNERWLWLSSVLFCLLLLTVTANRQMTLPAGSNHRSVTVTATATVVDGIVRVVHRFRTSPTSGQRYPSGRLLVPVGDRSLASGCAGVIYQLVVGWSASQAFRIIVTRPRGVTFTGQVMSLLLTADGLVSAANSPSVKWSPGSSRAKAAPVDRKMCTLLLSD
ncbi:unnamed protein product [Soboliphyme baturini]|uniref:DUF4198 domain-containing protein n=1 Tax=Soboliphyme baturini TaxID=241478 RepID=A0A183IBM7_9BILA|nr:unnamed protein product [Soboliphyme baturini]